MTFPSRSSSSGSSLPDGVDPDILKPRLISGERKFGILEAKYQPPGIVKTSFAETFNEVRLSGVM
jgi:hypothetical protein